MKNINKQYPFIIKGDNFSDKRGIIRHNNNFDLAKVKRIYEIENISIEFKRGWKGHKVQNRWFLCSKGEIQIEILDIRHFNEGSVKFNIEVFNIDHSNFDILFVPKGYATRIKQKKEKSRVMVFADYYIDYELDELRW